MNYPSLRIAACAAVFGLSASVHAQTDPAAIRDQLAQAISRGDVTAATALYADDAVVESSSPGTGCWNPCAGKETIRKDIESRVAAKFQPTTLKHYVSGTLLTTKVSLTSESMKKSGTERIIVWIVYETKDGKILSERSLFELSDPQTMKVVERLRKPPAQQ